MTEERKGMIDISKLNIYALSTDKDGAPLPIFCTKCKTRLTTIFLNGKCTIDIDIECYTCGTKSKGRDLHAELHGKIRK